MAEGDRQRLVEMVGLERAAWLGVGLEPDSGGCEDNYSLKIKHTREGDKDLFFFMIH